MHVHGLALPPVRGHRLGGQLLGRDRKIRVLIGRAGAVDAGLDVDPRDRDILTIFARAQRFRSNVLAMPGHTIVCGDDALGMRIIEELRAAGPRS